METITLDGAQGESGGQILRSALTLSMISGRAFRLERIRAGAGPEPALLRQHLTARAGRRRRFRAHTSKAPPPAFAIRCSSHGARCAAATTILPSAAPQLYAPSADRPAALWYPNGPAT